MKDYIVHHGIDGQKWGERNGPPYPLDPKTSARIQKKDLKWARKNEKKIRNNIMKKNKKTLNNILLDIQAHLDPYNKNGKLSRNFINEYNQRLAEMMNMNVDDVRSPSGQVVRFVAKRASDGIGTYMALASENYDMTTLKRGVYGNGRIGYRKTGVDVM